MACQDLNLVRIFSIHNLDNNVATETKTRLDPSRLVRVKDTTHSAVQAIRFPPLGSNLTLLAGNENLVTSLKSFSKSFEPALNNTTCPDSDEEHQYSFYHPSGSQQHRSELESEEEGELTEAETDKTGSSW